MKKQSLAEAQAEYFAIVNSDLPDGAPERAQAVRKWDTALFNAGVYALAARGLAAINAEAATDDDRETALDTARGMVLGRVYATDTLLALSKATGRTLLVVAICAGTASIASLGMFTPSRLTSS